VCQTAPPIPMPGSAQDKKNEPMDDMIESFKKHLQVVQDEGVRNVSFYGVGLSTLQLQSSADYLKNFNPLALDLNLNALDDPSVPIILKNAPNLTRLSLLDNDITDDGIKQLLASKLPLKTLRISNISSQAFQENKTIQNLYLDNSKLLDLETLCSLRNLISLQVLNTPVSNFAKSLIEKLQKLRLRATGISDSDLIQIAQHGVCLRCLGLQWEENVWEKGYEGLVVSKSIEFLEVSGDPGIPARSLVKLLKSMAQLRLFISSNSELANLDEYKEYNKEFRQDFDWFQDE